MNTVQLPTDRHHKRLTIKLSVALVVSYTLLLAAIGIWNNNERQECLELQLLETARAYRDLLLLTRAWNAQHGGVYVELSDDISPPPYLDDQTKDIENLTDKKYTKINPAFMTRMLSEIATESGTLSFKLSSLLPKNPANQPDDWERFGLTELAKGRKEIYQETEINGIAYFRYLTPLLIEPACLKCHAKDGQAVGDIRGGLTINIPLEPFGQLRTTLLRRNVIELLTVWLSTIILLIIIVRIFAHKLSKAIEQEVYLQKLQTTMQMAGATAHELRQPLSIIMSYSEKLHGKSTTDARPAPEAEAIIVECRRMNDIIKQMLNITSVKTKPYTEDYDIIDFQESAGPTVKRSDNKNP